MDTLDIQEYHQFEQLIQGLIDDEYGCCDDFLLPSTMSGLRNNMELLLEAGNMKTAGIGNSIYFQKDLNIRGDKVNWIDNLSTNSFEAIYKSKIQRFINHLNKTCFTAINSFESHYASYALGHFYKRHIDQFKTKQGRQFSIVLYLNENWTDADNGMLSLYPLVGEQKTISPIAGRLVFFRSDEMEHEVLPSLTRERRSIACWLKN